MLSRIVPLRRKMAAEGKGPPLKLVIMSATLRTQDFVGNARLFPVPPPLVNVPARQYPVTLHFSRQTEMHDYAGAVFAKVGSLFLPLLVDYSTPPPLSPSYHRLPALVILPRKF